MTDKNDDPGTWLAAQFEPEDDAASSQPASASTSESAPASAGGGSAGGDSAGEGLAGGGSAGGESADGGSAGHPPDRPPRVAPNLATDLPLRRPVLPTRGGYTWGLTPGGISETDAPVPAAPVSAVTETDAPLAAPRPYPVPVPAEPASRSASRPFFPEEPGASPPRDDQWAETATGLTPASIGAGQVPDSPVQAEASQAAAHPSITGPQTTAPPPAAIPTIEEVLDSPSPRRAAREVAAREAAARQAAASGGMTTPPTGRETSAARSDETTPALDDPQSVPTTEEQAPGSTQDDSASSVQPTSDVDNPASTTTAEMRALFSGGTDELAPDSSPGATAAPDHPAPDHAALDHAASDHVATELALEPGPTALASEHPSSAAPASSEVPAFAPKAHVPLFVDEQSPLSTQEAKPPRNQRVVLFVLLGLVGVLAIVIAANYLL